MHIVCTYIYEYMNSEKSIEMFGVNKEIEKK